MRKKTFLIKCPATVLGIVHEKENVKNAFDEFKKHVTKGKKLYVEGKGPKGGYELLVNYADENEMEIVRLDSKKNIRAMGNALEKFLRQFRKEDFEEELLVTASRYWLGKLRERKWVLLLRTAQKGDIVVMHPIHAYRIAPFIGIDRKNMVWCDRPSPLFLRDYRNDLRLSQLKKLKEIRGKMREKQRKLNRRKNFK